MFNFSTLPLWAHLSIFIIAASIVWISGTKLSIYADVLTKRTGLSHAFMGFLLLATITELPELATNTVGALRGDAILVLNSMTGGITMQTAILAIADFTMVGASLTYLARKSINILQSVFINFTFSTFTYDHYHRRYTTTLADWFRIIHSVHLIPDHFNDTI